ncbi:hypothetical protein HWV62_31885 [Athelia sp. TMB]|nr:hypothetical protein HWV62_31885 [Athelia sp. TMB]
MALSLAYKYITVPLPSALSHATRPTNLPLLAKLYSQLRLEILLNSPGAFASNYAIESKFTPEQWEERLWRDGVTVFVCVARSDAEEAAERSDLGDLNGEWVGAATVFGPIPKKDYSLAPESGSPEVGGDAEETKWQMTALFTSPSHRGQGLAKSLIKAGKAYARVQTLAQDPEAKRLRVRIMAHPKNLTVAGLYANHGFHDVARATGREAFIANGDESLIAAKIAESEEGSALLASRSALVMEYVELLRD